MRTEENLVNHSKDTNGGENEETASRLFSNTREQTDQHDDVREPANRTAKTIRDKLPIVLMKTLSSQLARESNPRVKNNLRQRIWWGTSVTRDVVYSILNVCVGLLDILVEAQITIFQHQQHYAVRAGSCVPSVLFRAAVRPLAACP